MTRRLLLTACAAAILAALGAGIAYATGTLPSFVGPDGTISACVQRASGQTRLVQPGGRCHRDEAAVQWSQRGPAGPAGAQGAAGKDGRSLVATPIAKGAAACGGNGGLAVSYDDGTPVGDLCNGAQGPAGTGSSLAGSPCTRADGTAGTIDVAVGSDNGISLSCAATSPPPPPPCDACGTGTAPVLAPIVFSGDAAGQLAFTFPATGTVQLQSDCGGSYAFSCGGTAPALALTYKSEEATPDAAASRYLVAVGFELKTTADIPMTLPGGGSCGLGIDTTRDANAATVSFDDNVLDSAPDGPTEVGDVALSGLLADDLSISGGFVCQAFNPPADFVDTVSSYLQAALTPWIEQRGVVCGDAAPLYFQDCTTGRSDNP